MGDRRLVVWAAVALLALALCVTLLLGCGPKTTAPSHTSAAAAPGPQPDTAADIVHATRTGKRYHRAGCVWLKSDIPMTRAEAEQRGLTPCKVCKP